MSIPIIQYTCGVVNTLELLNREKWDLVSSRYLAREFSFLITHYDWLEPKADRCGGGDLYWYQKTFDDLWSLTVKDMIRNN